MYKTWRPDLWRIIKGDYDLFDSLSESDDLSDFLPSVSELFQNETVPESHNMSRSSNNVDVAVSSCSLTTSSANVDVVVSSSSLTTSSANVDVVVSSTADSSFSTNELKAIIDELRVLIPTTPKVSDDTTQTLKDKIKECFQCSVCTEVSFSLMFCDVCQNNVGCVPCISVLNECPLCRGEFTTRPVAYRITGLEEIVNSPDT